CIQPAIAGDSGCRPFHGLATCFYDLILGLAPQALCLRLLRRLRAQAFRRRNCEKTYCTICICRRFVVVRGWSGSEPASANKEGSATSNRSSQSRSRDDCRRRRGFSRWTRDLATQAFRYSGRDNLGCEGRQTAFCERLRLRRRSEETACVSARHSVSSGFNIQTLYM